MLQPHVVDDIRDNARFTQVIPEMTGLLKQCMIIGIALLKGDHNSLSGISVYCPQMQSHSCSVSSLDLLYLRNGIEVHYLEAAEAVRAVRLVNRA